LPAPPGLRAIERHERVPLGHDDQPFGFEVPAAGRNGFDLHEQLLQPKGGLFDHIPTDYCLNPLQIRLESVSPGEKFDVPLGVYSQIKVTYKPVNKFHTQTGVLTKSSNLANEQKMLVKNNSRQAQLLTIIEPIPKATDEKIKASLGNGTFEIISPPNRFAF
jgi:hypothetical protein